MCINMCVFKRAWRPTFIGLFVCLLFLTNECSLFIVVYKVIQSYIKYFWKKCTLLLQIALLCIIIIIIIIIIVIIIIIIVMMIIIILYWWSQS